MNTSPKNNLENKYNHSELLHEENKFLSPCLVSFRDFMGSFHSF